jgi:hypothetical protein
MMDFMDSLRRGVDRAGFEMDRLLRGNRIRSRIGNIRSETDEEYRQIGREIMELFERNEPVPEVVRDRCEQVMRHREEVAALEIELEAIEGEIPPDVESGTAGSLPVPKCPNCGRPVHQGANFCSSCGAGLTESGRAEQPLKHDARAGTEE